MTVKPQLKHVIGILEPGEKSEQNWNSSNTKGKGRAASDGEDGEKREDTLMTLTPKKVLLGSIFEMFFKKSPHESPLSYFTNL